jgi:hypothetical protein
MLTGQFDVALAWLYNLAPPQALAVHIIIVMMTFRSRISALERLCYYVSCW